MSARILFLIMVLASAVAAGQPSPAARGMDFATYIRLERGMSEGELFLRAGQADQVAVENLQGDLAKAYYYFPTNANPFLTVVTVRGGRIVNIERTKKL